MMRAPLPICCLLLLPVMAGYGQRIDSLERQLAGATGAGRVEICLHLANAYARENWTKAVQFGEEAVALAAAPSVSDSMRFESHYILSISYLGLGNAAKGIEQGRKALDAAFNIKARADALQHLGRAYEEASDFPTATEYLLQAIALHTDMGNRKGVAGALNALSFVYKGMGQYEKGIEALKEAAAIYTELGNKKRVAATTFNTGLMILEMNRHQDAIPYFWKAIQGMTEKESPNEFGAFYNNLANCYEKLMDHNPAFFDSSIHYGRKNLELRTRLNDLRGMANANNGLAATYERGGRYNESLSHAQTALRLADSLDLKRIRKNALMYLITASINLGKTEGLSRHFEQFIRVSNQMAEEASARNLLEMTTRFETEKKEAENRELLERSRRQRQWNVALAIGAGLLVTLAGLLLYFYRGLRRAHRKSERQKQQIAESLREKEALLREIHHRVKNNLQIISSLLNMQTYYANDPRMIHAIAEGQNRVKAMALIHQKLYQTDNLTAIDFQEYAEQLIGHLAAALAPPGKTIRSHVNGSSLKLDIDTAIPLGLILNELITNSYKYAFSNVAEGELQVHLSCDTERNYHLRISDSGSGLPPGFNEHTLNSLGLKLVRMLTEQLDGTLTISNQAGAHFYIRFRENRLTA
jgi:two-component sensor histidine kinase